MKVRQDVLASRYDSRFDSDVKSYEQMQSDIKFCVAFLIFWFTHFLPNYKTSSSLTLLYYWGLYLYLLLTQNEAAGEIVLLHTLNAKQFM